MREKEPYSRGYNAGVWIISRREKFNFPTADLVRITNGDNKFMRIFYMHKIAQLLFPGQFINVIGARIVTRKSLEGEERQPLDAIRNFLYSQQADVSSEHATFSAHMDIGGPGKVSLCRCGNCASHREFHHSNALAERAYADSFLMKAIGIMPPNYGDPSDYCLTREGKIVFFEIEFLNGERLKNHLSSLRRPNPNEQKALALVRRYNKLLHD